MTDITKYTKLKRIVAYFLDECDKSYGDFDKWWIIAFRALIKIGFSVAFETVTLRLLVNGNGTVTLPPDYLKWSKIGILNNNNEITTLKVNPSLTTWAGTNPNRESMLMPDVGGYGTVDFTSTIYSAWYLNFYYNGTYTPLFGTPNGLINYGECRVDEVNGVIILSPNYPFPDLMLEYISSPQKNDDYEVETCCQEAVIAFLKAKAKLTTMDEFYAELREARRSLKPIQEQKIQDAIRSGNGFKLKV